MLSFTEDTFEQAVIELFENMGYTHIYAPDHDPGRNGCQKYGGPDAAVPGALLQPLHAGDG